jgi:propanol-preferring alcohol dehydrogenase
MALLQMTLLSLVIHMRNIPSFPYRRLVSVANLTRQDGIDFLRLALETGIVTETTRYSPSQANQALANLRAGRFEGTAVPVPGVQSVSK